MNYEKPKSQEGGPFDPRVAADHGQNAYRDGLPLAHNPFDPACVPLAFSAWDTGWRSVAATGARPERCRRVSDETLQAVRLWDQGGRKGTFKQFLTSEGMTNDQ